MKRGGRFGFGRYVHVHLDALAPGIRVTAVPSPGLFTHVSPRGSPLYRQLRCSLTDVPPLDARVHICVDGAQLRASKGRLVVSSHRLLWVNEVQCVPITDRANSSHSKHRSAALSSRDLQLSFGHVVAPCPLRTMRNGDRQTRWPK